MGQEGKWQELCTLGIILLERSLILVQKLSKLFSTIFFDSRGVAQPGSATVLGTVGREFESRRPDHKKSEVNYTFLQDAPHCSWSKY